MSADRQTVPTTLPEVISGLSAWVALLAIVSIPFVFMLCTKEHAKLVYSGFAVFCIVMSLFAAARFHGLSWGRMLVPLYLASILVKSYAKTPAADYLFTALTITLMVRLTYLYFWKPLARSRRDRLEGGEGKSLE